MHFLDWIIRIGAAAGAIAALLALWQKIAGPLKDMQSGLKSIEGRMEKIEKHDTEQYLGILRLTVMSEEMPISERLIAGQKYAELGGNGAVKHYYQNFVRTHTIQNSKNEGDKKHEA